MGQGRENAKQFLKENEDVTKEIENRIREYHGLLGTQEVPAEESSDEGEDLSLDLK
jgi:recombination protein RecA